VKRNAHSVRSEAVLLALTVMACTPPTGPMTVAPSLDGSLATDSDIEVSIHSDVSITGDVSADAVGPSDASPVPFVPLNVSSGEAFSCAVASNGGVACWGRGDSGQLGDGLTTHNNACESREGCTLIPVRVVGLTDAQEVAAGGAFACARRSTGGVVCWGRGGALGDGAARHSMCGGVASQPFDCSRTPVAVAALSDAVEISASLGAGYACARRATGGVVCWGDNYNGTLGNAGAGGSSSRPVAVDNLAEVVQIATGGSHACALVRSGAVYCWGSNELGQLGDGTRTSHGVTMPVSGLNDAIEISAGSAFSCAVRAGGGIVCWGYNGAYNGALGDGVGVRHQDCGRPGFVADCSPTPVSVTGVADATEVSSGVHVTCAVRRTGELVCWGINDNGELGDGVTRHGDGCGGRDCSPVPVRVQSLNDVTHVAPGGAHNCAIGRNGTVRCWGVGTDGQYGDGTRARTRFAPETPVSPPR